MKKILTTDDKQYLRATSRYLQSLGQKEASLDLETNTNLDDIDLEDFGTFSSNYRIEIPTKVKEIFKKVLKFVEKNDLFTSIDEDYDVNYETIEISIDTNEQVLTVSHRYSYYEEGDWESTEFSVADGYEELTQIFDNLQEEIKDSKPPKQGLLRLDYSGSGDSGYIEDYFEGNYPVPGQVEDFAYGRLESLYGGWEINEGSRGYFIFDLKNKTVTLNHSMTIEQNSHDTIFEESFAK